jgi:integrase
VFALPKGGKEREVPLSPSVEAALRAHLKAFPAERVSLPWAEPAAADVLVVRLVFHRSARPYHRDRHVNAVWRPALEAAGIVAAPLPGEKRKPAREHGMHALRHYFASVLLTEGEAIQAVSEWLGHHSPRVTLDIYTHVMPKSGLRMRGIIDRALSPGASTDARELPDPAALAAAPVVSESAALQAG